MPSRSGRPRSQRRPVADARRGGQPQRGELPGQRLRAAQVEPVGDARRAALLGGPAVQRAVGRDGQRDGHLIQQPRRRAVHEDQRDAGQPALGGEVLAPGQVGAVDQHDERRPVRRRARARPWPAGQHVVEQPLQGRTVLGDQAYRSQPVGPGRVQRVRQPLEVVPFGPARFARTDRDQQLGRGVEHGQLGDHRADQSAHPVVRVAGVLGTADVEPGQRGQRDRDRQVRYHGVGVQEPAQRSGGRRLQILQAGRSAALPAAWPTAAVRYRSGPRRSRRRRAGAPRADDCPQWTTAPPARGAGSA